MTATSSAFRTDKTVHEGRSFHILFPLGPQGPQNIPGIGAGNAQIGSIPEDAACRNAGQGAVTQDLSRSQLQDPGVPAVKMKKRAGSRPGRHGSDTGVNGGSGRIPVYMPVRFEEL